MAWTVTNVDYFHPFCVNFWPLFRRKAKLKLEQQNKGKWEVKKGKSEKKPLTHNLDKEFGLVLPSRVNHRDGVGALILFHRPLNYEAAQGLPRLHADPSLGLSHHLPHKTKWERDCWTEWSRMTMAELPQWQVIHNLPTLVHVSFLLCAVQWITAGCCDWRTKVERRVFECVWRWILRILSSSSPCLLSSSTRWGPALLWSQRQGEVCFQPPRWWCSCCRCCWCPGVFWEDLSVWLVEEEMERGHSG